MASPSKRSDCLGGEGGAHVTAFFCNENTILFINSIQIVSIEIANSFKTIEKLTIIDYNKKLVDF